MKKINSAQNLERFRKAIQKEKDPHRVCIAVCGGTGCLANSSQEVISAFEREIEKRELKNEVEIRVTGCHGFCERGPLVVIHPQGIFYQQVTVEDVSEIVSQTVLEKKVLDRLLFFDPATNQKIQLEKEVPFYKEQTRLIFGNKEKLTPPKSRITLPWEGIPA